MVLKHNKTPTVNLYTEAFYSQRASWLKRRLSSFEQLKAEGAGSPELIKRHITFIKFALKRLDQRQYGLCVNCGCLIEPEKLDEMPETPKCFYCDRLT